MLSFMSLTTTFIFQLIILDKGYGFGRNTKNHELINVVAVTVAKRRKQVINDPVISKRYRRTSPRLTDTYFQAVLFCLCYLPRKISKFKLSPKNTSNAIRFDICPFQIKNKQKIRKF